MSDPNADADDWLTRLREAMREPAQVPEHVVRAGYGAYTWRTIEAELAELTYDSIDEQTAARVRSRQQATLRALTFVSASLTVELEVAERRLLGQLVPPQPATITMLVRGGGPAVAVEVDQQGCFRIERAPEAPFRLRVTGERTVETDWITV
jgi:hypothetical protein